MAAKTEYAPGEIVRLGKALYERDLRAQLEPGNIGKYLAINIETGEWEMGEDHAETALRARAKYPDAGIFGMRIGYPAAASLGGRLRPVASEPGPELEKQ